MAAASKALSSARQRRWQMVSAVVLVTAAAVVTYRYGGGRAAALLMEAIEWIRAQGPWAWGLLILFQVVVCLMGVAPASLVVLASGGLYGLWYGFLLAIVATFTGGVTAFLVGRFLAGRFAKRGVAAHLSLRRMNEELTTRGWRFAFLLRMSPIFPFGLLSYGLGLSTIRWRHFLIGNFGAAPSIFALTYTGAVANSLAGLVAGERDGNLAQSVAFALGLLATLAIVTLLARVTYGVVRQLQGSDEER